MSNEEDGAKEDSIFCSGLGSPEDNSNIIGPELGIRKDDDEAIGPELDRRDDDDDDDDDNIIGPKLDRKEEEEVDNVNELNTAYCWKKKQFDFTKFKDTEFSLEILKKIKIIEHPEELYAECVETTNRLSERGILDKYVITPNEAEVLCAFCILLSKMDSFINLLSETGVDAFIVLFLKAVRKLPQCRGRIIFFNYDGLGTRGNGWTQPFIVGSTDIKCTPYHDDVKMNYKVENAWGYDISDFTPFVTKTDFLNKGKFLYPRWLSLIFILC